MCIAPAKSAVNHMRLKLDKRSRNIGYVEKIGVEMEKAEFVFQRQEKGVKNWDIEKLEGFHWILIGP